MLQQKIGMSKAVKSYPKVLCYLHVSKNEVYYSYTAQTDRKDHAMTTSIMDDITSTLNAKLILTGCVTHPANWIERQTRTDYTLWNLMEGCLYMRINGKTFHASPGDVVLFYPNDTYQSTAGASGCKFLFQRFRLYMGSNIDLMAPVNLSGIIPMGNRCLEFTGGFLDMYNNYPHFSLKLYTLFLSYLTEVIDQARKGGCRHFYSDHNTPVRPVCDIHMIVEYINSHITEDLSMNLLSTVAGLSEKHFITQFGRAMGVTPGRYIQECRMKYAAQLLAHTDKKLYEIAAIVGYGDAFAFSKTFKKVYGESPANYRKSVIP